MKAFVATGKAGDCIASLPILWHERHAERPTVIVSKAYAHIYTPFKWLNVDVYNGDWTDLSGALKYAKAKYAPVVSLSVFGRDFPIEHRTTSFQLEPWERAGVLPLWDKLEYPEVARSSDKIPSSILFCDHSESSPFLQKEDLVALVKKSVPNIPIIRTSSLAPSETVWGLLPIYDAVSAIITIDTMHLHLSAFTKTPVLALAADRPTKWNGSAWSKRFAFYCRYGEFSDRKEEFIEALGMALNGENKPEIVEIS